MQDKFQKIYVGTNEGIASVVDCLVNSTEKDIFLIIPPENKNFQNLITLKLLKREAKTLGKNIIIISSNQALRKLASGLGLRVIDYFQIGEAELDVLPEKSLPEIGKISDISAPASSHLPSFPKPKIEEPEEEKKFKILEKLALKKETEKKKEKKEESKEELEEGRPLPEKKRFLISANKFFISLLFLICLGTIGFAFFSLPKAKVEVVPKTDIISFDLAVTLDKGISEVSSDQKKIPAQLVKIEREAKNEFLSSGKKFKESKARGIITVYNNYNSAPQTLVATTRFISETGKLFRTISTITVPGARVSAGKITPSTIDVEVAAAETGEDYNIGPSTFSIPGFAGTPKYTGFYGKSTAPMAGGFKGEVKFVSREDIERAKSDLEKRLATLEVELTNKIPQNLKLVEGAQELKFEEVSQVKAGDEKERFEMTILGKASALVFNEDDLKKLIEENIASKIVTDSKSLPKTQKINYSIKSVNFKEGKADVLVKAEEGVTWKIDVEDLQKNLTSKTIPEVKEYLSSLVSIENAKVTLWPFWIKKFPSKPEKIKIEIVL